jgi:electron transfer flavoprotein alpha subunit
VSGVLALVELTDGVPDRLSAESLGVARTLASSVGGVFEAVIVAPAAEADAAAAAAGGLGGYGVASVHLVTSDRLTAFAPAAWGAAVAGVVSPGSYDVVVAPGSELATEVLAHVAARMGAVYAANVVSVEPGDRWRIVRQRWAGSLLEEAWLDGEPRLLTVAPHAVPQVQPSGSTQAAVQREIADIADGDLRARVVGQDLAAADRVSLSDAKVVVGGGRGLGSADAFAMLDELAGLLGAAVGVSRVATSLGWRPHAQQIGQTGTRIAPDLYIACGISGAIQHIVGAKAAKRILVINTDPDAPIFKRASYAVIGDVHAVVPAISNEIRRVRGGG